MVSAEQDLSGFDRGIYSLAALIRPVFGPSGKYVAVAGATGHSAPEFLTDGATIARRVTEVGHPLENAGVMFLRGLLWDVHERVGDGTSMTAILFDALYREGRRGIRAGLNAARLRHHLLQYTRVLHRELEVQRISGSEPDKLKRLAYSICNDEPLANAIARIFSGLGSHGHVEIRPSRTNELSHEFLGDSFWPSQSLDSTMLLSLRGQRIELTNCALFVSDLAIDNPQHLVSALSAAKARGASSLIIIGRSLSKSCLGLIMTNTSPAFRIIAMRTPETTANDRAESLHDIATLTGATVYLAAAGTNYAQLPSNDLGMCRRAWVSRTHLGLFGGQGESQQIRNRVRSLRLELKSVDDKNRGRQLNLRLSRLTARSAVLWINGTTDRETEYQKRLAERTCKVTREAIEHGLVPGQGEALVECNRSLKASRPVSNELEESFVIDMLVRGLEEPAKVLAENAGTVTDVPFSLSKEVVHASFKRAKNGQLITSAGPVIFDSFAVVATALHYALTGVAQALTVDTVVLHRSPDAALRP